VRVKPKAEDLGECWDTGLITQPWGLILKLPIGVKSIHDLMPTSEFRSIPDAGHLIQEDATKTVTQALYDFVE